MFVNALRAEWLKLSTSKSLWWTSGIILVLVNGVAWLAGWGQQQSYEFALEESKKTPELPPGVSPDQVPPEALQPVPINAADFAISPGLVTAGFIFAIMVFMIMAVLTVTGEYGTQMMKTTLQAIPNRAVVVASKVLVYGVFASLLTIISYVTAFFVVQLPVKTPELVDGISLTNGDFQWSLWANVLYVFLVVILGVGTAFLLRRTAGALALLLLWKLVVELMVIVLPKIGDKISEWMPFSLMDAWVSKVSSENAHMPWDNINYNPVYFGAICVAILIAGTVALYRRDA